MDYANQSMTGTREERKKFAFQPFSGAKICSPSGVYWQTVAVELFWTTFYVQIELIFMSVLFCDFKGKNLFENGFQFHKNLPGSNFSIWAKNRKLFHFFSPHWCARLNEKYFCLHYLHAPLEWKSFPSAPFTNCWESKKCSKAFILFEHFRVFISNFMATDASLFCIHVEHMQQIHIKVFFFVRKQDLIWYHGMNLKRIVIEKIQFLICLGDVKCDCSISACFYSNEIKFSDEFHRLLETKLSRQNVRSEMVGDEH